MKATLLPITMQDARLGVRLDPPRIGEHGTELMRSIGYGDDQIAQLRAQGVTL